MTHDTVTTKEVTFDATGQKLGRLASQVAHVLLGKSETSFVKNTVADTKVIVENIDALDVSEKKRTEKVYTRYSGHPGGLKKTTLQELVDAKGMSEALKVAVQNMLPKNRLRKSRLKNLIIK